MQRIRPFPALFLLPPLLAVPLRRALGQDLPAEVAARLRDLAARAAAGEVVPYGESRGGRRLLALRLTARGRLKGRPRPGVLLVAGLDGRRLDDVEVALRIAARFAAAEAGSPEAKALARADLWLVPAANPDGLAQSARGPLVLAGNGAPEDEDRDLREGEDPPDDLDGDGKIARMRIRSPEGAWLEDPQGFMRRADPAKGERGRYRLLPEGRDDDGDGFFNEDPPGGVRPDRNFPHLYPEHGRGAGRWVLSAPCARALARFLAARPQIAVAVELGSDDGLRGKPKANRAARDRPLDGYLQEDLTYVEELARLYKDRLKPKKDGRDPWEGRFHSFAYATLGRFAFAVAPPGALPPEDLDLAGAEVAAAKERARARPAFGRRRPRPRAAGGAARRAPLTRPTSRPKAGRGRRLPWHELKLEGLGVVEVGGLVAGSAQRLSPDEVRATAGGLGTFLLDLFDRLPAPRVAAVRLRRLSPQVVELRAIVTNEGWLPPRSAAAKRLRSPRRPRLEIWIPDPKNGELRPITIRDEDPKLLFGGPWRFAENLGGEGSSAELRWLLRAGRSRRLELRLVQEGMLLDRREVRL